MLANHRIEERTAPKSPYRLKLSGTDKQGKVSSGYEALILGNSTSPEKQRDLFCLTRTARVMHVPCDLREYIMFSRDYSNTAAPE